MLLFLYSFFYPLLSDLLFYILNIFYFQPPQKTYHIVFLTQPLFFLHMFSRKRKCLNKLLEYKADVNIRNNEGLTTVNWFFFIISYGFFIFFFYIIKQNLILSIFSQRCHLINKRYQLYTISDYIMQVIVFTIMLVFTNQYW